ncbi:MAG: toxin-activating lysine-acyltransferase [Hyphomicrobiaceae bacterium]
MPLPNADKVKQISASFGEIVAVLLRSKWHRDLPMTYLERVAVPAVMTGQFALAEARSAEHGYQAPVAVVMWACVSNELDRKLAQDPTLLQKLNRSDWKSGDNIWIVEAVGKKDAAMGLIEHLRKDRFKGKQVRYREVTESKDVVAKLLPT